MTSPGHRDRRAKFGHPNTFELTLIIAITQFQDIASSELQYDDHCPVEQAFPFYAVASDSARAIQSLKISPEDNLRCVRCRLFYSISTESMSAIH